MNGHGMRSRTFIVAEAGVNHNGDPALARALIEAAAHAGADAIKFQIFVPELTATSDAPLAPYQEGRVQGSMLDMLHRLALDDDQWPQLAAHAAEKGLVFFATAFDLPSLERLLGLGVPCLKIPSGEIVNLPLVRAAGATGLPGIMSTGMADASEIRRAVEAWDHVGGGELTLLHCTTAYPTAMADVHLRAMLTLSADLGRRVGYSDHTIGHDVAVAAVALGACVIEKHLTLDRGLDGPDHAASATPDELGRLVRAIHDVETALGRPVKAPTPTELAVRPAARRSLFFRHALVAGHTLEADDLVALRPGTGFPVERIDELVGRDLIAGVEAGQAVEESLVAPRSEPVLTPA